MRKVLYSPMLVLAVFFLGRCQPHQGHEPHRWLVLQSALATLASGEESGMERAVNRLHDLAAKYGSKPEDTLLRGQAGQLVEQVEQTQRLIDRAIRSIALHPGTAVVPSGEPGAETTVSSVRQRLYVLDEQALRLAPRQVPYSRTERIPGLLALAEEAGSGGPAAALLTGLRMEIAIHTRTLLAAAIRQMERRFSYRRRLFPVARQFPDSVATGESYRVEIFPLEIFDFSPGWPHALYVNGKRMPFENGVGKVRFPVEGPVGKRTWEGEFTFRRPDSRDTSIYQRFEYFVLPK